jgi:hypothetical protein
MIFSGMDPYLEASDIWPGVHASFIVYLRDHLQPRLRPRYLAAIEERVFVEGPDREIIPDVWLRQHRPQASSTAMEIPEGDEPVLVEVLPLEVHETYIAILDRHSGQRVVTVIEVVADVQAVLAQVYEAGSYGERLNYTVPCVPPLCAEDQVWANQPIQQAQQES